MKIKNVKSLWVQETYDIEMFGKNHNFFANDIIVSNSHSVAYSVISVWTMYLKMHHSLEYYAALLETVGDEKKLIRIISEYKKSSDTEDLLPLFPIDINKSYQTFCIDDDENAIRAGFSEIKWVWAKAAEAIVEERTQNWPFKSFEDFMDRIDKRRVNKWTRKKLCMVWVFNNIWGFNLDSDEIKDIKKWLMEKWYRIQLESTGEQLPFETKRIKTNSKKIKKEELEEKLWDMEDIESLIAEKEIEEEEIIEEIATIEHELEESLYE